MLNELLTAAKAQLEKIGWFRAKQGGDTIDGALVDAWVYDRPAGSDNAFHTAHGVALLTEARQRLSDATGFNASQDPCLNTALWEEGISAQDEALALFDKAIAMNGRG